MNKILIDTNIYSYAMKGDKNTISVLQFAKVIAICSISIGELFSGFKRGNKEKLNREELNKFLDAPRVQLYSIDEGTAEFYAETLDVLKKFGKPIPTNDIWIAAVAFQYGLKLFSKDQHFKHIPGLVLIS